MTSTLVTRSISCFALLAWLTTASVGAEPAAKVEMPKLVSGDAYEVLLVGQKADETNSQYILVKQTDECLVFACIHCEGSGYECYPPYEFVCDLINDLHLTSSWIRPEEVPLLGKWLTKRTSPTFQKAFFWIPRANIATLEHAGAADGSIYYAVMQGENPKLGEKKTPLQDHDYVYTVLDKDAKYLDVDSPVELTQGQISFITRAGEGTKVPLADIRLIHQTSRFDYAKFKAEHEKKQPAK